MHRQRQRKVDWVLDLKSNDNKVFVHSLYHCLVLVGWKQAYVDLPGLTWTLQPSVPIAASSMALCVSALIWNPTLMAYTVGWAACGYVESPRAATQQFEYLHFFPQSGSLSVCSL